MAAGPRHHSPHWQPLHCEHIQVNCHKAVSGGCLSYGLQSQPMPGIHEALIQLWTWDCKQLAGTGTCRHAHLSCLMAFLRRL